jgi:hypothetical protein
MATPHRAECELPAWLGGNDILGHAKYVGIHAIPIDAANLRWSIATMEKYQSRAPGLVTLQTLKAAEGPDELAALAKIDEQESRYQIPLTEILQERDRIMNSPAQGLTSILQAVDLVVGLIDHEHLEQAVSEAYEQLSSLSDEGGDRVFPDLSVRFVSFSPLIVRRLTMARALLRVHEEPTLLRTAPTPPHNELAFGTATHLAEDLAITRDAYLAPLFLALSPWIWCIACPRIAGVTTFDFGRAIIGRYGQAAELLQSFLPTGAPKSGPPPGISPIDTLEATEWWVRQLDLLLGEMTDYANYASITGVYEPRRHVESVLSIEQLGRRIQGVLTNDRDIATQRALAFDALDTLDGMNLVKFDQACNLRVADRTLAELEAEIPTAAANVLLPAARSAVVALRDVQSGFFMSFPMRPGGMELPDNSGAPQVRTMEEAAAMYLRVLRNAHHGFTPGPREETRRRQILLAAHNGSIKRELSFLPYLYWLSVVAHPERIVS